MESILFTVDGIFFSAVKEEVVEKAAKELISVLVEKHSTVEEYLQEGNEYLSYSSKVNIPVTAFMDTYNKIMSIKVRVFKEIVG